MFGEVSRREEEICNEYKIDGKTIFLEHHGCSLAWLYTVIYPADQDKRADIDTGAFVTNNFANFHSVRNSLANHFNPITNTVPIISIGWICHDFCQGRHPVLSGWE
jgi:hypothetical protein